MCDCPEARRWREYWTYDAIADRLAAELDTYRDILVARERDAINDVRGLARMSKETPLGPWRPSFEELQRRRAEPGVWPPPRRV